MIPSYAYVRYSSDNQREESIEDQLSYINAFADRSDIALEKDPPQ